MAWPVRVVDTPRGDWSALADRPSGWKIRRLTTTPRRCRYVLFDPAAVDLVAWLSPVPDEIAEAMRAAGFLPHPIHAAVWIRPTVVAEAA